MAKRVSPLPSVQIDPAESEVLWSSADLAGRLNTTTDRIRQLRRSGRLPKPRAVLGVNHAHEAAAGWSAQQVEWIERNWQRIQHLRG